MGNSEIFIEGLGISGYRSFGPDIQRIGPFNKINFFIGQNNSGKSNILRFLKERYKAAVSCDEFKLSGEDLHIGKESPTIIELGMTINGEKYCKLLKMCGTSPKRPIIQEWIETVLNSKALTKGTRLAWFRHKKPKGAEAVIAPQIVEDILSENVIEGQDWQELWHHMTKQNGGELKAHWIPQTLQMLSPFPEQPPGVALIPAFREVKGGNRHVDDYSGTGLIISLFKLQNPSPSMYGKDKAQFEAINEFLITVLVNPTAKLEIPHDMKTITVIIDDKPLSLSSVGAGIHEVIILAAWATVLQNQIICIEEPEIHFHPLLQKHGSVNSFL